MGKAYSVSQVNAYVKNMFTQDFFLNKVSVKGEVSNCKYHSSGHIYFTLKDSGGVLSCVMFAGQRKGLAFRLEEGLSVIVSGTVDVYERDGKYQLYAKEITREGAGDLYQKFEALKAELEEMGMFAEEYKQPVPKYIQTLGVVTAPTGAAVRDIIQIATRRNPFVQIILYPAKVQGIGAAESIVAGIKALEEKKVDTIIVGRGGGSIEDLWAFNEEITARAIFECSVPVISAVGHETDVTIADYVADLRAPTPSAGAELAVYDYEDFVAGLFHYRRLLNQNMQYRISSWKEQIDSREKRLNFLSPEYKVREKRQYLAELHEKLNREMGQAIQKKKHQMALCAEKLEGLSPLKKLQQGFSYVEDEQGKTVYSVQGHDVGDKIKIHVTDGVLEAIVEGISEV